MGIKHAAVKASGETGLASEWNDDHVIDSDVDFGQNQLLGAVAENLDAWPPGPEPGRMIFRTDQTAWYVWNGIVWVAMVGPATVVVAADGSGQYTNIQAGINALPAAGGVVYVKEGNYLVVDTIVVTNDNVAIVGAGRSTRIYANSDKCCLILNGADYFHIEKIFFQGRGAPLGTTHTIAITNAKHGRIINCWIEDAQLDGIGMTGTSEDITFSLNVVQNSMRHGIHVSGNGNKITNNTTENNALMGIMLNNISNAIVAGNSSNENKGSGIYVHLGENNIITGNNCQNNDSDDAASYDGITLHDSNYNVVVGNRCKDNDRYEIYIDSASCNGNVVVSNNLYGTDRVSAILDNGTGTEIAHNKT